MKTPKNTYAYARFELILHRTNEMLEVGLMGANKRIKEIEDSLKLYESIRGLPEKVPQKYNPKFQIKELDSDYKYSLKVVNNYIRITEELKNHYYSILLIYIWAAYETYYYILFQELFHMKIEMLKTNENASYTNIIDHRENILDFIIDKELEKIGHFSIEDHFDYLDKKINFKFSKSKKDRLRSTYLVRNIIAHNTGIVNKNYKKYLPKTVKLKGDELILSRTYLEKEIINIKSAVGMIEKYVK